MEERQQVFIECVRNRLTESNKPLIDTVLKAYALNEGLVDTAKELGRSAARKVASAAGKVADKAIELGKVDMATPGESPVKVDYPALRRAMIFEKDCWERDYAKFEQFCDFLVYFISNYGMRDFNAATRSDSFRQAMAMGAQLDKMRMNPLIAARCRQRSFNEALDALAGEDRVLIEGIRADFTESETVFERIPLVESREDNLAEFRNAIAGIANFIRRHGLYPWTEFLRENRMLLARASRFDPKDEYAKDPNPVPGPSMAADIMRAYHSGSSDEYRP